MLEQQGALDGILGQGLHIYQTQFFIFHEILILAVQWLRLHASTQVAHVGSLVREVPHASQCTPPPQKKIITENVKLLEENIGSSICDHGLGNYFLDMTFKA